MQTDSRVSGGRVGDIGPVKYFGKAVKFGGGSDEGSRTHFALGDVLFPSLADVCNNLANL